MLVYGERLGLKLLQSENTIPMDFMGKFLNYITSVDPNPERFKTLHAYAQRGPMFLSGSAHIEARKKIAQFYKKIEVGLAPWLTAFTKDYLLKYKNIDEIFELREYDCLDYTGKDVHNQYISKDQKWRNELNATLKYIKPTPILQTFILPALATTPKWQ